MQRRYGIETIGVLLAALIGCFIFAGVLTDMQKAQAATYQKPEAELLLSASSTVLDGTTTGKTYQNGDRRIAQSYTTDDAYDNVDIKAKATGASGSAAILIWGYSENGPAELIYSGTATLGTAVASGTEKYIDTFTADPEYHLSGVDTKDTGNNRVAKLKFDFHGYKYIMFEVTLTTITDITFIIREYGFSGSI